VGVGGQLVRGEQLLDQVHHRRRRVLVLLDLLHQHGQQVAADVGLVVRH